LFALSTDVTNEQMLIKLDIGNGVLLEKVRKLCYATWVTCSVLMEDVIWQ